MTGRDLRFEEKEIDSEIETTISQDARKETELEKRIGA
jgi:hypothetical protein